MPLKVRETEVACSAGEWGSVALVRGGWGLAGPLRGRDLAVDVSGHRGQRAGPGFRGSAAAFVALIEAEQREGVAGGHSWLPVNICMG